MHDNKLYQSALRYLQRREHSYVELARKLTAKGFNENDVHPVLESLVEKRYLSDDRFAEHYVRYRMGQGYGPVRIRAELHERGVADELIDTHLAVYDDQWAAQAERVRCKRFGSEKPCEFAERVKQAKFLQYRGFLVSCDL